jgi:hypothetical protein
MEYPGGIPRISRVSAEKRHHLGPYLGFVGELSEVGTAAAQARYRPNVPLHGLQDRPIGNNGYSSSPTSRKSSVAMSAATRRRKRLSTSSIGPKGANDEQNLKNRRQNRRRKTG